MLLREEYIAAFTHEDQVVRNTALELVTQCKAGGMDATRQALRAIIWRSYLEHFRHLVAEVVYAVDDDSAGVEFVRVTTLGIAAAPEPEAVASWVEADNTLIP